MQQIISPGRVSAAAKGCRFGPPKAERKTPCATSATAAGPLAPADRTGTLTPQYASYVTSPNRKPRIFSPVPHQSVKLSATHNAKNDRNTKSGKGPSLMAHAVKNPGFLDSFGPAAKLTATITSGVRNSMDTSNISSGATRDHEPPNPWMPN